MPSCDAVASHLRQKLDEKVAADLRQNSFAVVDNAWPQDVAEAFLEEIELAWECEFFQPNKVQFLTNDGTVLLTKPGVYEVDMHQQHARMTLPTFRWLLENELHDFINLLNERFPEVDLLNGPPPDAAGKSIASMAHVATKIQINKGGAFPWHYDNPAPPNRRRLTVATYLCPELGEGGEVMVMPFLGKKAAISPRFNRMVIFYADQSLHRVLPVKGNWTRYCFTMWLDSLNTNSMESLCLREKHLNESSIPQLVSTPLQRSLSRVVYDEEYLQSLLDCFGNGTEEAEVARKIHDISMPEKSSMSPTFQEFVRFLRELAFKELTETVFIQ